MINGHEVIALIPARSGSKSVLNKNIRKLLGRPLIAYSIETALKSRYVDRVIVSTDSSRIAKIAVSEGAEAPFLRPRSLSGDRARDIGFAKHALQKLGPAGSQLRLVVILRPTEPYRRSSIVDLAIETLSAHHTADSLRSVTLAEQTPFKMWFKSGRYLKPILGSFSLELFNAPRQSLPLVYWQNGYVDVVWESTIMKKNSITGKKVLFFEIEEPTTNIDSLADLKRARSAPQSKVLKEKKFSS